MAWLGVLTPDRAALAQVVAPEDCPLVKRLPGQKCLVIVSNNTEREETIEACRNAGLMFDVGTLDYTREDYSSYHLIVLGSNVMDYWSAKPERSEPAAFDSLETFVKNGGHLMVFNTFNGRSMKNLTRFGVKTGFVHGRTYVPVPGLTEVLFAGAGSLVPEGDFLQHSGNFSVSAPHLVLLRRGPGQQSGTPCLVTIPHGRGRLTYTSVEPVFGNPPGYWLVHVMIHWAQRGAPVLSGETDPILYDTRPSIPSEAQLTAAAEQIRTSFGPDPENRTDQKLWAERAEVFQDGAADEQDPALRYLLLKRSTEAFAQAGDGAQAVEALDRWTSDFAVPRTEATLTTLQSLADSSGTKWQDAVRQRSLACVDEALSSRDVQSARALVQLATKTVQESRNRRWTLICQAEEARVDRMAAALEAAAPWFERLKADPSDPKALRETGKVQCFVLRDWDRGLISLSRGDDERLRHAAELELSSPSTVDERVDLGEVWMDVAEANQNQGVNQLAAEQRAAHWLSLSLSDLKGLRRASVQQKLARLAGPEHSLRVLVSRSGRKLQLVLTPAGIQCRSVSNHPLPDRITWGDSSWAPGTEGVLLNTGLQRVLPRDLHLSSVRVDRLRSRGTVTIESATEEQVVLNLEHTGDQLLPHEFTLVFGPAR